VLIEVAMLRNEQEVFSIPAREATQKTFHKLVHRAREGQAGRRKGFCMVIWNDGIEEGLWDEGEPGFWLSD
jgi:hypothetical protein